MQGACCCRGAPQVHVSIWRGHPQFHNAKAHNIANVRFLDGKMLLATSMQAGVARQLGQRPVQAIVVMHKPARTLTGAKPAWGPARRSRLQRTLPVRAVAQTKEAVAVGKLQQLDIKACHLHSGTVLGAQVSVTGC